MTRIYSTHQCHGGYFRETTSSITAFKAIASAFRADATTSRAVEPLRAEQIHPSPHAPNTLFYAASKKHKVCFANKESLKILISLNPTPPAPFGRVSLSHVTQHIFFNSSFASHQKRVR
ncbi:hypothetical protein N665_0374s0028 [Sinapis alba]|nr:hypothetical protein N665_0374s0028 [Sinapis alba]